MRLAPQTFELISQGLRYWIAGLCLFIFFRAARGVRRSFKIEKRIERQEQGGFSLGVLEVLEPGNNAKLLGQRYLLRKENRIGKGGDCDIRIQERSLASIQALIYQRRNKVFLSDYGSKKGVGLNGYRVKEDIALMDGDEIQLSHVVLQLRLQESYSATRRKEQAEVLYGDATPDAFDDTEVLDDWEEGEWEEEGDWEEEYGEGEEDDEYDPYDPV